MKAERAEEPHGAKHRKQRGSNGAKPRRTEQHGPIGFANVMGDVAGGSKHGGFGSQQKLGQPQDMGTAAMLAMGAVATTDQVVRAVSDGTAAKIAPLVDANVSASANPNAQQTNAAQANLAPTNLGNMTPAALLTRVLDEATKLEIETASKTLHVELEPAHLGPLVVSLRREPNGALDIRFRAKRGDAARVIDAGSDGLRDRLAAAGFTTMNIVVDHDERL